MNTEIEDIKRRLDALEKEELQLTQSKPIRKKNDYQIHMSQRLKELKNKAELTGNQFNRKEAFSLAAKEWTAKKNSV
jgi:predicted nuclease with TOPRIM domain